MDIGDTLHTQTCTKFSRYCTTNRQTQIKSWHKRSKNHTAESGDIISLFLISASLLACKIIVQIHIVVIFTQEAGTLKVGCYGDHDANQSSSWRAHCGASGLPRGLALMLDHDIYNAAGLTFRGRLVMSPFFKSK